MIAACGSTPRRDLDYDRMQARLDELGADAQLSKYATAERAFAETMLRRLDVAGGKEHEQLVYLAERRVDIAYIAAQTGLEADQLAQLERDYAALQLDASRRETEAARAELDRQRRQEIARQEEAQRSATAPVAPVPTPPATPTAETPPVATPPAALPVEAATGAASTLAERLAAIAPELGPRGAQMTLEDLAFEPGQATLRADAGGGLDRLLVFVERDTQKTIRIEGHTDATGSAEANRNLSLRRAEAVRDALVARGIPAERIRVYGLGEDEPVAPNDEAEGRALNRRVVVILESGGAVPGGT
ncbi:MAG TPA: OmpA family protein [Tahibacter sp.]|nr:OmpA family protein [Tahibacter sp.]